MGEAEWNADPKERDAARCSRSAAQSRAQPACLHLIMGSVIESATTPLDGFNTGFFMCGVIMLVGGAIVMAFVNPEREAKRPSRRLQPLTASASGGDQRFS